VKTGMSCLDGRVKGKIERGATLQNLSDLKSPREYQAALWTALTLFEVGLRKPDSTEQCLRVHPRVNLLHTNYIVRDVL
jgi:hypothetical protein